MDMKIQLTIEISKQGARYVAYAPALDLSTSGKTEKEARKRFEELVEVFFEELHEAGTLQDVLSELGWRKESKQWKPPKFRTESVGIKPPVTA